ncbi:MAG: hypothetical protein DCC68_23855 [Planctomycetota bacterium]|nr:MAG: hypothetical protein DCC68_23855 [Planctomycetota bacterium]
MSPAYRETTNLRNREIQETPAHFQAETPASDAKIRRPRDYFAFSQFRVFAIKKPARTCLCFLAKTLNGNRG